MAVLTLAGESRARARRRECAIAIATLLAATASSGAALAQSCDVQCRSQRQAADQEALLAPFNSLLDTSEGQALLAANLQTEENIYLNSTQADKIASGTVLIVSRVPANVLLRAFPNNPNYGYDAQGLPTAPNLPRSIVAMLGGVVSDNQIVAMKPYFGEQDTYGQAYGYLPGQSDSSGNPPPYQVSAAIFDNPFTPANSSELAWQNQQTPGRYNINWALGDSNIGDFPSAHTMLATSTAIPFAILAPGYYQQLALSVANFSYDLNVFAVHYPLDVIGGRILGTYVIAEMLADNPLYASSIFNEARLPTLSRDMQAYLGGGGSSPYAAACANLVACVSSGVIPTAATYAQQAQTYLKFLTYGLPSVGDTTLAPFVPTDAHFLIDTRFPYLSVAQRNEILATTELPSGVPLDNGGGWARLNLYAAAGGYGAFRSDVTVAMDAAAGGLSAFDVWSNNISGPGGLTLQGSGTLILAGNDSFTGGVNVQGGALAATGDLLGPLSISPGARFVLGPAGTFAGAVDNGGAVDNEGVMTGTFVNSGFLAGVGGFGWLSSLPGSTIAPGDPSQSIATLHVADDLTLAGTAYQVQVAGRAADRIEVGGAATLTGGAVVVSLADHSPTLGFAYPILTAAGGISGAFASATTDNLPFIDASLSGPTAADANDVFVTLARNDVPYASAAIGPNQAAAANALDAGGVGSGLGLAIASQSAAGARQAFDALSGEVYASAQTAMLADSLIVRETLLGRMRQASFAAGGDPTAALANGGPILAYAGDPAAVASKPARPATALWAQAIGSWGRLDGDGAAAGANRTLSGLFSGLDRRFGANGLAGFAAGYTTSSLGVGARGSSATIDMAHLAAYGTIDSGPWTMRAGAAASFSALDVSRTIAFPGFFGAATANYDAATAQSFGEAAYRATLAGIAAEPFAGLALAHLRADGFAETGGAVAALGGSSASDDVGYSTLGLRAAAELPLSSGVTLTPRASAAWQHAVGAGAPSEELTFLSTGAPFAIAGLPLARDTALIESGLDLRLGPQARIGLSYAGQFGERVRNNALQGELTWAF